jgi:DNA-binding transcriptional ArsR family regulator
LTDRADGATFNRVVEHALARDDREREDRLSAVFAALAEPTRRDMVVRLVVEGDATLTELAEPYGISVQAVAKHLAVLEEAGVVSRSRTGRTRPARVDAEVFDLLSKWIERYRAMAEERYRRLDAVLAEMSDMPDTTEPQPVPEEER